MNTELISIILPTYNRQSLLRATLESVKAQSYAHFELIIVDDGSTDQTESLVKSFLDPRFQYYKLTHLGRSHARNYGLSKAQGAYITFIDSDDLYTPNKLEEQIKFLQTHAHFAAVYSGATFIDTSGKHLDHKYSVKASGNIHSQVALYLPLTILLPTVMFRKRLLESLSYFFDEVLERFEDTDFWRRLFINCSVGCMPKATCLIRTHHDNSLGSQDISSLFFQVNQYTKKVFSEDKKLSLWNKHVGCARLFSHYGEAILLTTNWRSNQQRIAGFAFLGKSFLYFPILPKIYLSLFRFALSISKELLALIKTKFGRIFSNIYLSK